MNVIWTGRKHKADDFVVGKSMFLVVEQNNYDPDIAYHRIVVVVEATILAKKVVLVPDGYKRTNTQLTLTIGWEPENGYDETIKYVVSSYNEAQICIDKLRPIIED